jgi:predicted AAA+ superfamily ATPase
MNIIQIEKDNLYKGLGLFLEGFRPFLVSVLMRRAGGNWVAEFENTLSSQQLENWNEGLRNGTPPEALIDFHHFKFFAIKNKDLLKADFGKKVNDLPNWLNEIAELRHRIAHFKDIDEDEAAKAWIHMKAIAKLLKMDELEVEIVKLKDAKPAEQKAKSKKNEASASAATSGVTMPWFRAVVPHLDIRQGRLDESVFAANLAEVAIGGGREIYSNPVVFFSKTFFTSGLKTIAKTVIKGLNGNEDAENRVMSLQTGFGGGKTHTLISLFHIAKWGRKAAESETVSELLSYTGKPKFDKANIAVFTNTTNDPTQGRQVDGITIRTLWGELAYQLGGMTAYEIIRPNDEARANPKGLFKKVLEHCRPALILIDELADYCVSASAVKVEGSTLSDQTISFMQELTQAVSESNNCVAIITLPASAAEVGNTAQAFQVLTALEQKVRRIGSDTKPVADEEIYEVIRRRLFEEIGDAAQIEAVASKYLQMYQENWMELPPHATKSEYKEKIKKSYPFHPELIDVFRVRWASSHTFQRTRGVLRLLAAIVSDLWKRRNSLTGSNLLIDTGDVNFANLDALSGQLKSLFGNAFDAVITADVSGSTSNAFKIDQNKPQFRQWNLAEAIASTVLLNSFGSDGANKGVSTSDIKLNLLEPDGFNHNSINGALDELEAAAYYLYYAQSGTNRRFWFHTKPNINILINQVKDDIKSPEIEAEILRRINEKSRLVQPFNVLVNPTGDVPEQQKLTLVVLNPQYHADGNNIAENTKTYVAQLATKKGNSERIYRNTILFLAPSDYGLVQLVVAVKDFLACKKISDDYASQLEPDQKADLRKKIDEASKQAEVALVNAYSTVLKYSVKNGVDLLTVKQFKETFDGQVNNNVFAALKDEEWLLESIGLGTLQNNNLVPTVDTPIKAKDVYEAFIRFDDKKMITNMEAVRKSLIKYCYEGAFCIASGDGKAFTKYYLNENVPFLDVNDANYWLVDKSLKPAEVPVTPGGGVGPVPPVSPGEGDTPDEAPTEKGVREFRSITISGSVALERYSELFNYFITPFAMNGNKLEIQVSFKIGSTENSPLTESAQLYKNAKEAAKQLGLNLHEDEKR